MNNVNNTEIMNNVINTGPIMSNVINTGPIMSNVINTGPIMSTGLPKKCGLQSCVAGMWLSHQDLILGNTRQEGNTSKGEAQSKDPQRSLTFIIKHTET